MIEADKLEKLSKLRAKNKQYLHSPAHLLAAELSSAFNDAKHFGLYLKFALTHNPDQLRKIAQEVKEQKNVRNPGRLFVFLVKKSSTNHE